MTPRPWNVTTAAGLLGLGALMGAALTSSAGSAAHLEILDAGVAQYWEFPVQHPPPAPANPEPPAACGAVGDYAGVLYAKPGEELVAPSANGEKGKGYILIGTDGPDRIIGSQQNDCLVGLAGDDVLLGGNGSDILIGGPGADTLDGQQGPDTVYGDESDTCVVGNEDTAYGCPPSPPKPPKGPKGLDETEMQEPAEQESFSEPEPAQPEPAPVVPEPPAEPDLVADPPAADAESDGGDQ